MEKSDTLYKTPSGMGGVFRVRIVGERIEMGEAQVVSESIDPEWNGIMFWTTRDKLTAI